MRTKSTALIQYLKKQYPKHLYWGEPFFELSLRSQSQIIKNKEKFISEQIEKIFNQLFSTPNNIIKILGINLNGMYKFIDKIYLEKFDHIYLIERKDFFDQVCSKTVANETKVYHKTVTNKLGYHKDIQSKKYTLTKGVILSTAADIYNYIMIKKYLIEKNIPFIQYYYEIIDNIESVSVIPNDNNYSDMVTNYALKKNVNDLFYKHFDYITLQADFDGFKMELDSLLF